MRDSMIRFIYLFNRLKFRISIDGFLTCLKEIIYFNKEIILVEKEIKPSDIKDFSKDLHYTIIDTKNSKSIEKKYHLPLFDYYAQINCKTLIAEYENDLVGFIRWTEDKNFRDLLKFEMQLKPNEAYMFDFFLFPKYRGSSRINDISNFAMNHLKSIGKEKFYGFVFSDNVPALWWHRTVLRAHEYKKLKLSKFIILEWSKKE